MIFIVVSDTHTIYHSIHRVSSLQKISIRKKTTKFLKINNLEVETTKSIRTVKL